MAGSVVVTGNIAVDQLGDVDGHGSVRLFNRVASDPVDASQYMYGSNGRVAGDNHGACRDKLAADAGLPPRRCIVSGASFPDLIHYLINVDEGLRCGFHKITCLVKCPWLVHG